MDRVMSKSYDEFKNRADKPEPNEFDPEDPNILSIEEAREDIMSPGA